MSAAGSWCFLELRIFCQRVGIDNGNVLELEGKKSLDKAEASWTHIFPFTKSLQKTDTLLWTLQPQPEVVIEGRRAIMI
ncbi:hypothetical protein DPEC_G00023390 [Dallia pectoralis]|uniref:Uncharacterized protein n=1 Tax=Dallia pectoralis TaxID=75939 RepID=A0ACC2HI75_DALPE|nr:hypothetical protein DPEC_G00023390 [Dallia pectoralis]